MSANPSDDRDALPMNFTYSLEDKLRGMAGAPAFVRRARRLEVDTELFWKRAEELYNTLKAEGPAASDFARRWRATAEGLNFSHLEGLVADYNAYYPIEANLPIDPLIGDFTFLGKRFERKTAPTLQDVLERFPASLRPSKLH